MWTTRHSLKADRHICVASIAHPLYWLVFVCWSSSSSRTIQPSMYIHISDYAIWVPPWLLRKPDCHLDLSNEEKAAVQCLVWELWFYSVIDNYKDHIMVFTERSKTANGVGSLFVVQGTSYSWALPRTVSVYIWQALWYWEHWGLRRHLHKLTVFHHHFKQGGHRQHYYNS